MKYDLSTYGWPYRLDCASCQNEGIGGNEILRSDPNARDGCGKGWTLVRRPCALIITICGILLLVSITAHSAGAFDSPLTVQHFDLGINPDIKPEVHNKITCSYYPALMIKEVNTNSIGEGISIVPMQISAEKPPCAITPAPNEIKLPSEELVAYFMGLKSNFIFLLYGDPNGEAQEFNVFDARSGNKLFDDFIKLNASFRSLKIMGTSLIVKYRRAQDLNCSLYKENGSCWAKAAKDFHLASAPPDCSKSYGNHIPADDPSTITYNSKGVWDGKTYTVTPQDGSVTCSYLP
jgi:hypothetical protein